MRSATSLRRSRSPSAAARRSPTCSVAAARTKRRPRPPLKRSRSNRHGEDQDQADRLADPPARGAEEDPDRSRPRQDASRGRARGHPGGSRRNREAAAHGRGGRLSLELNREQYKAPASTAGAFFVI